MKFITFLGGLPTTMYDTDQFVDDPDEWEGKDLFAIEAYDTQTRSEDGYGTMKWGNSYGIYYFEVPVCGKRVHRYTLGDAE